MTSQKVRFSIGAKLILIICAIVILSLTGITFLVSYFVTKDIRISTEENNLTINSRTASECQSRIDSALSSVGVLSKTLSLTLDGVQTAELLANFFEKYPQIAAVYYAKSRTPYINRRFFAAHEIEDSLAKLYAMGQFEAVRSAKAGGVVLQNASTIFKTPMIAVFAPVQENPKEDCVVIYYSSQELFEGFSSGSVNQSFFCEPSRRNSCTFKFGHDDAGRGF